MSMALALFHFPFPTLMWLKQEVREQADDQTGGQDMLQSNYVLNDVSGTALVHQELPNGEIETYHSQTLDYLFS